MADENSLEVVQPTTLKYGKKDATEVLINVVRKFPLIHDNTRADYKDNKRDENAWKTVSESVGFSDELI